MNKKRSQLISIEVAVGLFIFLALLALGLFTIVLSQDNWLVENHDVPVVFDDVSGLVEGDKVYVHGVNVGRVSSLAITPEGVRAVLTLESPVSLREDYSIRILPTSVLGGKYVTIEEGTPESPPLATNLIVRGRGPQDFIKELTDGVQAIRSSLEKGGVLANLEATMENLRGITDRLQRGEGTIGRLLAEDAVYNDLRRISVNLAEVSERLAEGEGTLGKLLSKDDTLYVDLRDAVASLKDVAGTLSRGEGTLGKLAKDDEVYNKLNELLGEVRAAIDDMRETSPVVSFSSLFFGAF